MHSADLLSKVTSIPTVDGAWSDGSGTAAAAERVAYAVRNGAEAKRETNERGERVGNVCRGFHRGSRWQVSLRAARFLSTAVSLLRVVHLCCCCC